MPRNALLTGFIGVLILVTPLCGSSGPKGTMSLETVLKKVSEKQRKTETLEADFRQEKILGMLAKPEVSEGTFSYSSPNNVLWTYSEPKPVIMLITRGWLTTYYPQLRKAEKIEVRRFEDRIFKYLGASGGIDELARYFNFKFVDTKSESLYRLELDPKTQAIARRVKHITIWIDRATYLATRFEYTEADGDVTRYQFTNVRINKPIPAARFNLDLPSNVKVEQLKIN